MNPNFRDIASKLSTRGWITLGGALAVGVLFMYLLMSFASTPSYTTLVAGQSPAQAEKVTSALSAAGIGFKLSNNGTGVMVDPTEVGRARDVLGTNGLLAGAGGGSLSQYLSKGSLGESQFQQQEDETAAIEQQLDATIENMTGITSANVQLSIPNQADTLFTGSSTQPTASVLLETDDTLAQSAVKSIAGLVAGDVSGLNMSKILITDQNGDLLWPQSSSDLGGSLTAKQAAENAYDSQMTDRVDAMLEATLGPGMAIASVNANLDANQENIAQITYSKTGTPNSAGLTTETLTGTGAGGNGAAGTSSTNLAGYSGSSNGNSNYKSKSSTINYSVGEKKTEAVIAPGNVLRQSISVLVNSKKVPSSELGTIRNTVEQALGYDAKRGDTISIGSLPFAKVATPVATSSPTSGMIGEAKYVLVGVGALLFLFFMSRMLRKREGEQFTGQPTWLRELELPRPLSELESQTQMVNLEAPTRVARLQPPVNVARQQVEDLVDRDPERVAAQIRQWMTED